VVPAQLSAAPCRGPPALAGETPRPCDRAAEHLL